VAKLLGSNQSRVAKMEAADGSVTLDLLVLALLTSDSANPRSLARSAAEVHIGLRERDAADSLPDGSG